MEVFPWAWAGGIHRNALHEPAWDNPAPDLHILKIQAGSYSFVQFFPASIKNCSSPFVFFSNRVTQLMEILFFFFSHQPLSSSSSYCSKFFESKFRILHLSLLHLILFT